MITTFTQKINLTIYFENNCKACVFMLLTRILNFVSIEFYL